MLRLILLPFILIMYSSDNKEEVPRYTSFEKSFPIIWKANVGSASFRSNVIIDTKYVIFPSNGESFKDATLLDRKAGVYILDRVSGKVIRKIGAGLIGDMDVNGVITYNNRIFFGNDNDEFICSSKDGKIIWRNLTSGDIEHEPVLIKNGNKIQIIYATEAGEVCAVDPLTGKKYWTYYTPDFDGWKPNNNRFTFKIGEYFSTFYRFFTKPVVADMNSDGILDLTYVTNDSRIFCLNGKTGTLLWMRDNDNHRYGIIISNMGNSFDPVLGVKEIIDISSLNSYWQMVMLDKTGQELNRDYLMNFEYWGESLNVMKTIDNNTIVCVKDTIKIFNRNGLVDQFSRGITFTSKEFYDIDTTTKSRNDSESLIAQAVFKYKRFSNCILILNQKDRAHFDKGLIQIVSLNDKKIIDSWEIPSSSEFQPVINDVNMDGKPDLLVSGHDGFLYCYNLGKSISDIKYSPKFN